MDSTYTFGLLLVGLSAFLLAMHWHQLRQTNPLCKPSSSREHRWHEYLVRSMRRRVVASSLLGVVGFTLMAFETVPRTPLSITAYLLSLVMMTCWILWLACLDLFAGRRIKEDQQLDQIADQVRHAEQEASQPASAQEKDQLQRTAQIARHHKNLL